MGRLPEPGDTRFQTAEEPAKQAADISGGTSIFREFREYREGMKDRWEILYNAILMEFKRTIKNKWVVVLTVFTWLWGILIPMTLVIVSLYATSGNRGDIFDASDFYDFYSFLFIYLVLFSGYISAKNVTAQKADRTITLYLCRPISKLDYLIIKFAVLVLVLSVIIILPDILLFIIVLGLLKMPFLWNIEHLWVLGSIILYGLMIVSIFSLLSLAIASSTKKMHWAIAGIFAFLFFTTGLSLTMRLILKNDYVILISPWDNLAQVGAPLFATDVPYSIPWALSFGMLAAYVAITLAVLVYNINRVEVVE